MGRMVLEYGLNAMWQLPLLVAGAWLLLRVWRMEPGAQHGVWMGVLALAVVLPMHGLQRGTERRAAGSQGVGSRGVARTRLVAGDGTVSEVSGVEAAVTQRSAGGRANDCGDGGATGVGGDGSGSPGSGRGGSGQGGSGQGGSGRGGVTARVAVGERTGHALAGGADGAAEAEGKGAAAGWLGLRSGLLSGMKSGFRSGMETRWGAGLWARVRGRLRGVVAAVVEVREVRVTPGALRWVARVYGAVVLLMGLRVLRAWGRARAMLQESVPAEMGTEDRETLERESARMGVRVPEVRQTAAVRVPAVVGVRRPVLLVPEGFWELPAEERRAAVCHELAHLRRRDPLLQAISEVMALPVGWHPAIGSTRWGVRGRLRQTREMASDRMAAQRMASPAVYARCLLAIVRRMDGGIGGAAVMGMADGVLEERVMRLVTKERAEGRRIQAVRAMCGAAVCGGTMMLASGWHLRPVLAGSEAALPSRGRSLAVAGTAAAKMPVTAMPLSGGSRVAAVRASRVPLLARQEAAPGAVSPGTPLAAEAPVAPAETQAPKTVAGPKDPGVETAPGMPFEDGPSRRLTAAERARVARAMRQAQREIARSQATMNSPELRQAMRQAQMAAERGRAWMNSPEFKRQMEQAQVQVAKAQAWMNSPEFKRQMEQARVAGEQGQREVAQAQEEAAQERKEAEQEAAQDRKEAEREAAQEKAEAAEEKAEAAREQKEDEQEAARDRAEAAREKADEAREAAREKAEAARDRAEDVRRRRQEAVQDRVRAQKEAAEDRVRAQKEAAQDRGRAKREAAQDKAAAQQGSAGDGAGR